MTPQDRQAIAIEQSRLDTQRCAERLGADPQQHRQLMLEAWQFGLSAGYIRPTS